jgi:polyisoprenoid-binding protein YceI
MKASLLLAISLILIAGGGLTLDRLGALRAQAPESSPRTQQLRAGEIDTDLSRVFVFVEKTGFGHQHGVVGRLKEGTLRVAREAGGKIVFDMSSFRADTDAARRKVGLEGASSENEQEQVTANMLGAAVLDAEQFPTAFFVITKVQRSEERDAAGQPKFYLDGDFTLHGTKRRVRISATGTQERGFLHLVGHFPLRQTDFGIKPFKKALGAVGVADVLTVYGDLWVKQ